MDETNVDALVKSTLETLGKPVERLRFTREAETYITFQLVFARGDAFADDENTKKEYLYRADIFSKSDYISLIRKAENALKAAGFYGVEVNAETYENQTRFYHVPIEFYYMEGLT